jgi:hypothetical protein
LNVDCSNAALVLVVTAMLSAPKLTVTVSVIGK